MKIENFKLKIILCLFILPVCFMLSSTVIVAKSSYVLPYPSAMPGSIFYKLNLIKEEILKYWYFGDFGQFKYNLKQSDRYLVEAKTLFDYKQYLLADQALKKSDNYFKKIQPTILSAKRNSKNTVDKEKLLKEATEKHIEELGKLKRLVPPVFEWRPEKKEPQTLKLLEALKNSTAIRQKVL